MSEILILHIDSAGEDLYKKLVEVIKESGHNIQKVAIESCLPLQFDSLRILPDRHQVFQGSREIVLTMKEFQGRIFSKEQIYNVVWQELYSGDCNIVMSHIHNIREKIEVNPSEPVYIQTVWGVGYRFNKNLYNGL